MAITAATAKNWVANNHIILVVGIVVASLVGIVTSSAVSAINYGEGTYGTCSYAACSISLSSSGTVDLNASPVPGETTCSVQQDNISVSTGSSTGYTLTLSTVGSDNFLAGPNSAEILPTSGSADDPWPLDINTWGYRVSGRSGFGTSEPGTFTNGPVPDATFAAVPGDFAPDTIRTRVSTPPTNPDTLNVWYGLCIDTLTAPGFYTRDVIYTAVVN